MSLIFMDGFDTYANAGDLAFRYQIGHANYQPTYGRYGGGAMEIVAYAASLNYMAVPGSPTEMWLGWAFNFETPNQGHPQNAVVCEFVSSIGEEICINYNQLTAVFTVIHPTNGTVYATSNALLLTSGEWHWIDIHFKAHASAGIVEIWIDNNLLMNATGINTIPGNGGNRISVFGWGSVNGLPMAQLIDDFAIFDVTGSFNNGRIGDSRICTTVPNSDAGPNTGTPSVSGPHYAMVDEDHWSSSDIIIMANTAGVEEDFGLTALPVHPASIAGVQVVAVAEKTDAGTANTKLLVSSTGTRALGASQGVLSPYNMLTQIFEHDPHVNNVWTEATVDAAIIGYQVQ